MLEDFGFHGRKCMMASEVFYKKTEPKRLDIIIEELAIDFLRKLCACV